MPIISIFFGIVIRINFEDHNPPHLHASHGERRALFDLATGRLMAGALPRRETRYVVEWILKNRTELMRNWELAVQGQPTFKIEGLADE
jgi:DNA-binding IclR family transcriptional regulator